jgi:hypothetical protein
MTFDLALLLTLLLGLCGGWLARWQWDQTRASDRDLDAAYEQWAKNLQA